MLRANLHGANLTSANLQGANLTSANLQGAKFGTSRVVGSVTNLAGADLRTAMGLTQKQLDEACGDEETKLPLLPEGLTIKPCPDETDKSD